MHALFRAAFGSALVAAGGALLATGGSAFATGTSTTANVSVLPSLSISNVTSSFTLTGAPLTTQSSNGAFKMTVTTNNALGYAVTVAAAAANMTGAASGNTDTIPVTALGVRATGGTVFTPMTNVVSGVSVHSQALPSASSGDTISDDYQIVIPFVRPDTYSVTLNYTVTAL